MKKVLILGSTGSIGTQALDIIRNNSESFRPVGLTCRSRVGELMEQIREFRPEAVCVGDADAAAEVRAEFPELEVVYGDEGLVQIARMDCDIVLNALMGISGLAPTYEAVSCGRDIALANKETLVAGGELITDLCMRKGVRLLPVDSEHSAIFQCLEGNGGSACGMAYRNRLNEGRADGTRDRAGSAEAASAEREIRRILLTASGGPFRGRSLESLRNVTVEQALNHPKWSMGSKITIDSATMMNKGLEVIEARWLFDVPAEKIDIHVHPESIIHSMVEFYDGSVMAQMGLPDMRIPISLALNYPGRMRLLPDFAEDGAGACIVTRADTDAAAGTGQGGDGGGTGADAAAGAERGTDGALDLFTTGSRLTFEKPDRKVFRCIDLAYSALREGGSMPIVMNGANEELVSLFLRGRISFTDIPETIERVMEENRHGRPGSVSEILDIDRGARAAARRLLKV